MLFYKTISHRHRQLVVGWIKTSAWADRKKYNFRSCSCKYINSICQYSVNWNFLWILSASQIFESNLKINSWYLFNFLLFLYLKHYRFVFSCFSLCKPWRKNLLPNIKRHIWRIFANYQTFFVVGNGNKCPIHKMLLPWLIVRRAVCILLFKIFWNMGKYMFCIVDIFCFFLCGFGSHFLDEINTDLGIEWLSRVSAQTYEDPFVYSGYFRFFSANL